MMNIQYDWFHRGWNDVKLSAKKAMGYPWRCILQCVLLFNMNYSPFGTGAFFFKKQDVLQDYMSIKSRADPNFQACIFDICRERRQKEPETEEEEEKLWRSLAHMDNFQKKGDCVKLMRWMSFFEVAAQWRGDMWGTRLVLLSDPDAGGSVKVEAKLAAVEEKIDGQKAEQTKLDAQKELNHLKKVTGVWKLAPRMVTQRNVTTLDMLLLVCKSTWKAHANRAKHMVQPEQVLQHNLSCSNNMAWAFELEGLVGSLRDKKEISHMYPPGQEHDKNLAEHCDFFHQLLSHRASSLSAAYTLPPMRWNGVLSPNNDEAKVKRDQLLEEWDLLLKLEGASLHSQNWTTNDVLDKVYWRLGTYARVLALAHQQDKLRGLSCKDGSAYPLQLLVAKSLGDSRVIEVAHQQGPDLQRLMRKNTAPPVTVMHGTIKSGALELRKVKNTLQVDPQELVFASKNYRKVAVKKDLDPRGHKLDKGMQRMMRKRLGANYFPSPAPGSLFPSLAATEWAWAHLKEQHPGTRLGDAWLSCLGKPGDVLAHLPSSSLVKIVNCSEYGLLTWHMGVSSNNTFFMPPSRSSLHWMHITNLDDWVNVPTKPFVTASSAIEWMRDGQALPLPVALVQGGISLTVAQVKRLLDTLKIDRQGCTNKAALHSLLIDNVLRNSSERQKAKDAYDAAGQEAPLDSDLEEVISCLDEEDANNLDLKELKEKKKKKYFQRKKQTDAAENRPVPSRGRARGRGRGRGRPRGGGRRGGERGRGRGRGRVRNTFLKKNAQTASPCKEDADSGAKAPPTSPAPGSCPSPGQAEEEKEAPDLPCSSSSSSSSSGSSAPSEQVVEPPEPASDPEQGVPGAPSSTPGSGTPSGQPEQAVFEAFCPCDPMPEAPTFASLSANNPTPAAPAAASSVAGQGEGFTI